MFDPKDPQETITVTFDYSALGDIVENPAVTVRVLVGVDSNPSAVLYGSPIIEDNNKVLQGVTGGVRGCLYEFRCMVDIGSDRPLIKAVLPVQSGCISDQ